MTMQIIIDQSANGSIELVQKLRQLGRLEHQGDGFYSVEAPESKVLVVTNEYPQAVIKAEHFRSHQKLDPSTLAFQLSVSIQDPRESPMLESGSMMKLGGS